MSEGIVKKEVNMEVNHQGTKAIETARLVLRRFNIGDVEDIFRNWVTDEEVTRYLRWSPHQSIDVTQAVLNEWLASYQNIIYYNWAIVPKGYGKVIGCISVRDIVDSHARCETGFCIGREFWGKGYMTEALRAVTHYMLFDINLNRLQAMHNTANQASGKVMLKSGMKYEALLRQYSADNRGVPIDHALYSVLKQDIFNQVNSTEFMEIKPLTDGEIELVCVEKIEADLEKGYSPYYTFAIKLVGQPQSMGQIRLRFEFSRLLYYAGHIGYDIKEQFRGHSYSAKACQLVKQVAKQHGINTLLITNNPENIASRKICEKLGAKMIRIVDVPPGNEMYDSGELQKCIYQWDI